MYLAIYAPTNARVAFGSYPEPLFRAKISDLVSKNDLWNSYLNFYKGLIQSQDSKDGPQFIAGMFEPDNLARMRFSVNSQMVKTKYLWEYSKALAHTSKDDVVIMADPLLHKQIKTLKFIDDEKSNLDFSSTANTSVVNFIEGELETRLKDLFGETDIERLEKANQPFDWDFKLSDFKQKAATFHPNDFSFLQSTLKETTKIQSFEFTDSEEVHDKIFMMALLDVLHGTTLCESEFIDSKFFYLNPEKTRFSDSQIQDLDKRFYVSYKGIQKVKDAILENVKMETVPGNVSELGGEGPDGFVEFGGVIDVNE
jgi:hypothetical protein